MSERRRRGVCLIECSRTVGVGMCVFVRGVQVVPAEGSCRAAYLQDIRLAVSARGGGCVRHLSGRDWRCEGLAALAHLASTARAPARPLGTPTHFASEHSPTPHYSSENTGHPPNAYCCLLLLFHTFIPSWPVPS